MRPIEGRLADSPSAGESQLPFGLIAKCDHQLSREHAPECAFSSQLPFGLIAKCDATDPEIEGRLADSPSQLPFGLIAKCDTTTSCRGMPPPSARLNCLSA